MGRDRRWLRDAEVYHTAAWLDFLAATQRAEPVVAMVRAEGRLVGYFVGAIVRRYGVRILGSPLRGWTTQCMGFLLEEGFDRRAAADALLDFAFRDLRCLHVELADRKLPADQMIGSGYDVEIGRSFVVDLDQPEPGILARIRRTTRQELRKAERAGLHVETANDGSFADEFYGYLQAAFARQGLTPTYPVERVRALISALQPSGQVHMLRVRTPAGASIAASLSVGRGRYAIAWGMGFDRSNTEFHPIELLWWETMRSWKAAGASSLDLGGGGSYKAKYGGIEIATAHHYRSRWRAMGVGRWLVRHLTRTHQLLGGLRARRAAPEVVSGHADDPATGA